MKERSFHDRIHTIGRFTVICALVSFMAVPFVLAMVNHYPHEYSADLTECVSDPSDLQYQRDL